MWFMLAGRLRRMWLGTLISRLFVEHYVLIELWYMFVGLFAMVDLSLLTRFT